MARVKRGTIREDGKIFWSYHNKGKEYWVTQDVFENNRHRRLRAETDFEDDTELTFENFIKWLEFNSDH